MSALKVEWNFRRPLGIIDVSQHAQVTTQAYKGV